MATQKLGKTFAQCALGGVTYAAQCLQSSRVPDGLSQLSAESLRDGVTRGILESARRVGVPPEEITRSLPMREIEGLVARIGFSQQKALAAWHLHAGQLGGLLTGIADLTVDGRAPDAALCLDRLAGKVRRDRELAEPLASLATDIAAWDDLVTRCRALLDDGSALEKAYQRRRVRRVIILSSAVVMLLALGAVGVVFVRIQLRVREVLAGPDPCAAATIEPKDLERAGAELRAQAATARAACDARHAEEEAVRAKERAAAEHVTQCGALAQAVESGAVAAELEAFAGSAGPLLRRVAAGTLAASDLGPDDPVLPCQDTPSGAQLLAAFDRAVPRSPPIWLRGEPLAPRVRKALVAGAAALPASLVADLDRAAEDEARKAIVVGEATLVARAGRLCQLHVDLGGSPRSSCMGILALARRQ